MFKCQRCLRELEDQQLVISLDEDGGADIFCKNCISRFGTCDTCANADNCGFFDDNDPPQFVVVQRTLRQGTATIVQRMQVPNTERLRKFCLDGKCSCCDETDSKNPYCLLRSQNCGTCTNYVEKKYPKIVKDFSQEITVEN